MKSTEIDKFRFARIVDLSLSNYYYYYYYYYVSRARNNLLPSSLSLSETRGDGGREREIGTRPGRASTEASSVEKIRGEREQGHFGNHWPPRSGIETGSTIGR